jgi:long-chain acyl-CoA synthetase
MTGDHQVSSDDVMAAIDGRTVPVAFLATVGERPDAVALRWRTADGGDEGDDAGWGEWTWAEYADRVARAAAGLKALGVVAGDRVVLMLRNIPEFHVLDLAVAFCGATPVSIYNSSSADQVRYLVGHCGATVGIVEDAGYLARFLEVRHELPSLRTLAVLGALPEAAPDDLISARQILDHEALDLVAIAGDCQLDDMATLIYTSGTTGPPKAVMITHRNVAWTVESLLRCIGLEDLAGKRVVSYLPMAHIAERMTSHYQHVFVGYEVITCPEAGQIAAYLRDVRPNIVFGVPRVWEKIHAGVTAAMSADPEKAAQFAAGLEAAGPIVDDLAWDRATDDQRDTWQFLDDAGFRAIREMVGLDQCDLAITGAAPIPPDILRWYRAIGVPLSEIYGMSENSGPLTWAPWRVKPGTVGPAIPGCEVTLADDGEIVARGGNVFDGYLGDPEKTAEALDGDGWLHTGDIGEIDADGYIRIVDRKKELIITAGGKNISPANLEAALKMIPLVGQAMAIGDQRPFVSALVVLDPETAPAWARAQGIEFGSMLELADDDRVVAAVDAALPGVMAGFNNAERVKKVRVLGEEWLPDTDLLTPTSKLKRRGIVARYHEEIESLYA